MRGKWWADLVEAGACGSDCEVTDCVPVCVFDLTKSLDPLVGFLFLLRIINYTLVRRRPFPSLGSAVPLARWCVTNQKGKDECRGAEDDAQEDDSRVPESVRHRAPLAPGGTPPQGSQSWPGAPLALLPELDEEGTQR